MYMYMYIYVYLCISMCIYIYTHVYTCVYTPSSNSPRVHNVCIFTLLAAAWHQVSFLSDPLLNFGRIPRKKYEENNARPRAVSIVT